jgi:hypothetical protein
MPLSGTYRPILDRIALNQLNVPVYIPNPNLAIHDGEEDGPFNLAFVKYYPKQPPLVIPDPAHIPIEYTGTPFTGNPVHAGDFPTDIYLGNPIA